MHPFSILTLGIFVAGYITARWDLVTRLYELAIFAWEYGVIVSPSLSFSKLNLSLSSLLPNTSSFRQTRAARGFAVLSVLFLGVFLPVLWLATKETHLHPRTPGIGVSAREQLRRRGSF
jgi:phosphatidylinositol glycan class Q protein